LSVLEKDLNPDVKIGVSLPMDHIDGSGFFPGTSTTLTQTSSNIRNLLLTRKGERVGQPDFGCGLLQVLFEPMSDDLLDSVRSEIEESISFWLPHVTINNIQVERDEVERHQLNIILEFALTIQPTVHEVITLNFLVGD
jgi:uncharacterized protein|tara:strand:+ start:194 stop:610 length:417 start_codon:yes stop_codon:yes gene_type:complete